MRIPVSVGRVVLPVFVSLLYGGGIAGQEVDHPARWARYSLDVDTRSSGTGAGASLDQVATGDCAGVIDAVVAYVTEHSPVASFTVEVACACRSS